VSRDRRRTVRPDGRVRLRVEVPAPVVALADRLVETTGLDREAILGDLAAAGLPDVLASLADGAVARPARRRLGAVTIGNGQAPDEHSAALPTTPDAIASTTSDATTRGLPTPRDKTMPPTEAEGTISKVLQTNAERSITLSPARAPVGSSGTP